MSASPARYEVPRTGTTRERLLEAAIEMFAERGYAATGVDALCRRAGVAKTGLYWEFHNKVGLLNAVIDHVVAEWIHQIGEAARGAGTPRERLDLALGALRRRVQERPELFRVLLVVLAERTQVDSEAREALRRFHQSARDAVAAGIRASVNLEPAAEELWSTCDVILAMIEGVFLRAQLYGDEDVERLFVRVRAVILMLVQDLNAGVAGERTLDAALPQLT